MEVYFYKCKPIDKHSAVGTVWKESKRVIEQKKYYQEFISILKLQASFTTPELIHVENFNIRRSPKKNL